MLWAIAQLFFFFLSHATNPLGIDENKTVKKEQTGINETIVLGPLPHKSLQDTSTEMQMLQKHQYWSSINLLLTWNPYSFCKYSENI